MDFRLGIDGLALRVQASLGPQRALSSARVFQPRRDKVKILWYDRHGWWLMCKRLERGQFSSVTAGRCRRATCGWCWKGSICRCAGYAR
ncbi:MAG: IS66 family insertion sequence element accessory protein TnpB [Rhodanobacteraceae bacterium]|nr:IS66 family insertion sequence element accessory protein TnpB [Rhodanobacteraceae bacterium]